MGSVSSHAYDQNLDTTNTWQAFRQRVWPSVQYMHLSSSWGEPLRIARRTVRPFVIIDLAVIRFLRYRVRGPITVTTTMPRSRNCHSCRTPIPRAAASRTTLPLGVGLTFGVLSYLASRPSPLTYATLPWLILFD